MKNNAFQDFIEKFDFKNLQDSYFKESNRLFLEERKYIQFKDFENEVYNEYLKNRDEIISSYFQDFNSDLENKNISIEKYKSLLILEDYFDQSQDHYFSGYFLNLIKSLNANIIDGNYNEELLNFIWSIFDSIFHASFHLVDENELNYRIELRKLKNNLSLIDSKDEFLIQQKIGQFIR